MAEEVRNLAMRAAEAAKNTSGLIEGSVKKIHDGTELVGTASEAFTQVTPSAANTGDLVGEISAASKEQTQGVEPVNGAASQMDGVTQQKAASSRRPYLA